jgi:RNA polymerase primary sigma factor
MGGESDLGKYLKEIGRYPLLTRQQESELARRAANPLLTERERTEARQKLISSNLRLVVSLAKQSARSGVPIADLIAEGNLGLIKAIRRFDPTRGTRISTYATFWIRQSIQLAIRDHRKGVRLPAYMTGAMAKLRELHGELAQKLNRLPSAAEVHAALDPDTRTALKNHFDSERFGKVVSIEEVLKLQNLHCPEEDGDAASSSELDEVRSRIRVVLDQRETQILHLRYALGSDTETLTLSEIGSKLGITRERVRQLEARAIGKLQREFRKVPA